MVCNLGGTNDRKGLFIVRTTSAAAATGRAAKIRKRIAAATTSAAAEAAAQPTDAQAKPRAEWHVVTAAGADGHETAVTTTGVVHDVPVSAGPAGRAEAVGRVLQSSFAAILRRLPTGYNKVAPVARMLKLDRSICQRVVMGVRDATDGLGVIERFPGVRGLEQFLTAAQRQGCPSTLIKDARRAIDQYATLVNSAGGSQARLVGEIEVLRAEAGSRAGASLVSLAPGDLEKWRRKCYEGAVGLTGLASQARVEIVMLRPSDDHRGAITTVGATGMIGVEASAYSMPLVRRSRLPGLTPVPSAGAPPSGLTPDLLLNDFTSQPPPRVTTRTEGEHLIQVFNPDGVLSRPTDIVAALAFHWQWEDPTDPKSNYYSVGRVIGAPARRLVFDLYLHHGLPAPRSVSAHVLRPATHGSLGNALPQSRWFDRLPFEHDLTLLSGRPGDRPSPAYARLGELTRHLTDLMGWTGERFAGYRFEVSYPVFDMEYVISAEF